MLVSWAQWSAGFSGGNVAERKEEQLEQSELIQDLWLSRMIELLQSGEETATDRATLIRWLEHNGWQRYCQMLWIGE